MSDGRYAPSPTGDLHLGNLRTALLAWLFARSAGERFLLRIEDLDEGRVRERYVESQLDDLRALGLDWDGDVVRQSQRLGFYAEALERLEREGRGYRCFSSRREIGEAAVLILPDLATEVSRATVDGRPETLRVRPENTVHTVHTVRFVRLHTG